MYRVLLLFFTVYLVVVYKVYPQCDEKYSKGITIIIFPHYNFNSYQFTEKDVITLIDSTVAPDGPVVFMGSRLPIIITHEKYVKHQQELNRIAKIEGEKPDSLRIDIDNCYENNEEKLYIFYNMAQITEYIKILRLLIGEDEYLPIEHYIQAIKKYKFEK
ncbi:MAG: hypothetical protein EPN82_14590 [Bacteroidetes bacterium]|nr:MAG: hypothetical protein EPN82_14590 [Bacteroidota bacterium]